MFLRDPVRFDADTAAPIQQDVDKAVASMSKLPPHSGTTFWGTTIPPEVLKEWQQVEKNVSDRAFGNTSTEAAVAEDFRIKNKWQRVCHGRP